LERLIGDTLRTFGIGGALLAAAVAVAWWFFHDLHKQQGKGWWIALLRHDGLARRYRALMAAALDRLDARLSPGWNATPGAPKTEAARAWSHGLLNLCLLLAVAYPILSLLIQWALSGEAGRIGPLVVLPAEPGWLRRAAAISAVALMVVGGRRFARASTPWQHLAATGLIFGAVAIAVAAIGGVAVAVTFTVVGAVVALAAFTFAIEAINALARAFLHATSRKNTLSFSVTRAGARAVGRATLVLIAAARVASTQSHSWAQAHSHSQ